METLTALAAAAPARLRHLYLSEELSPSSFGDAALAPVLAVATGAFETTISWYQLVGRLCCSCDTHPVAGMEAVLAGERVQGQFMHNLPIHVLLV